MYIFCNYPVPVAARSKALVCVRLPAETVGLNLARGMNFCLLWMLHVARWKSPRLADHSSRGVLSTVVCRCLWSINLMIKEAIHRVGPQGHTKNMIYCKFSSCHVGFAAHNAVFIDTVTSQTGELMNKTTFTTYFQTLMVFLNPSNGII